MKISTCCNVIAPMLHIQQLNVFNNLLFYSKSESADLFYATHTGQVLLV